jgi:hypothetical protein
MSPKERVEAAHQLRQRRTLGGRVKKHLASFLGIWSEEYDGSDGEDALVATCLQPRNTMLGLYFESIKSPTFSSMLKRSGVRKRIPELEDGLERAIEIYGASRNVVGFVFDVGSNFFVYSGHPIAGSGNLDFMRIVPGDGEYRYICTLEGLLSGILSGDLTP